MNRVLITGSRTWTDRQAIFLALKTYQETVGLPSNQITLVSGHCPKGADMLAEISAKALGWNIERHPADWDTYGKRAGFIRNAEMVHSGIDICFAFIHNASKGATMTADLAQKNGIPVRRYTRTGDA